MSRNIEQLAEVVTPMMPSPVRREAQRRNVVLTGGDPGEVVVTLTASIIAVAIFAVVWDGPHTPVVKPRRVGSVTRRGLPNEAWTRLLQGMIDAARDVRRGSYHTCRFCGKVNPPEWLHDEATCQGCAERELRVVY